MRRDIQFNKAVDGAGSLYASAIRDVLTAVGSTACRRLGQQAAP